MSCPRNKFCKEIQINWIANEFLDDAMFLLMDSAGIQPVRTGSGEPVVKCWVVGRTGCYELFLPINFFLIHQRCWVHETLFIYFLSSISCYAQRSYLNASTGPFAHPEPVVKFFECQHCLWIIIAFQYVFPNFVIPVITSFLQSKRTSLYIESKFIYFHSQFFEFQLH